MITVFPQKDTPYTTLFTLEDANDPGIILQNPTIEVGDVQVVQTSGSGVDDMVWSNIVNLPETSGSGVNVLNLTGAEVSESAVGVVFHDPDGEWMDLFILLGIDGASEMAGGVMDVTLESTMTIGEFYRVLLSAISGKVNRSGSTVNFRDLLDTKNRISGTVNSGGERLSVTLDGSE